MNSENKKKRYHKKLIIGVIITTLILVIGTSYAFFTLTLKSEKDLTVTSGTLSLQYQDENAITLEKAYPISDVEAEDLVPYEFRIENTGDIKARYDIILEENSENTLNYAWLKYSLKRNEEGWSIPQKISSLKLEEGLEIDPENIDSYQLRLWIDEEVGNEAQNKTFKAKVVINSVQSNASTSDLTPPVITLNGSLSESVEQGAEYIDPGVKSVVDDRDELNISDIKVSYQYFDGETTEDVESIDTNRLGVYSIYYKIKDTSGNEGKVIRCVNVYKKNTVVPTIQLNGKSVITIEKGSVYQEAGATASKNGEDLTSSIVVSGEVNTNEAGTYEVVYTIRDEEGNTASVIRVVHVVAVHEGFQDQIKLDLNGNRSDKVHLEGENLGNITYTSSDDSIVSVDNDGNIEGQGIGDAVIQVTTSTGVEKEIQVTVVKSVTVRYEKLSGVESIDRTSDSCEVTTSGGSCEVVLPSITVKEGYDTGFWSTSSTAASGSEAGITISFSEDVTYYAKAVDTTKPVWSLVSVTPSSGNIFSNDTLTITFKGTDNSGSVVSTLVDGNIQVKVGTTVFPAPATLTSNDTNDGKEYTLTLKGLNANGVVSLIIGSNTLSDESGNQNVETVLTTGVTIHVGTYQFIVIGDKQGVPAFAMSNALKELDHMGYRNAEIVYAVDDAPSLTAMGNMDLEIQRKIIDIVSEYGPERVVVFLGQVEEDYASDFAKTVTIGDPTFGGALTGVEYHLNVYHIFDPEIKDSIPSDVWESELGLFEPLYSDIIDNLVWAVKEVRDEYSNYT